MVHLLRLFSIVALGCAMTLIFATSVGAQETPAPRAESVSVVDGRIVIDRPTGWNIRRPGEGAVAVFRAAADERAQIEIRVSDSISETRWERFWRTFDTDLQQAGFDIHQGRTRRNYGGQRGFWYEYEIDRQGDEFRMMVWHTHEENRAWVFTAFFAESRRSTHGQTFQDMLESLQW